MMEQRLTDGRGRRLRPLVGRAQPRPRRSGDRYAKRKAAVKQVHTLDRVVIRFAGDSGDGMQLTGDRFTADSAVFGNDISTLPNFPAEIRAPAGTLPGVSSFQLHFANYDIMTPGDRPDVLVAMNPAALKANIADLPRGGVIIADTADFTKRNLAKVGYDSDPLTDGSLADYQVHALDLTGMTVEAVKPYGLSRKDAVPGQEHVRAGPAVLALPPPHRGHDQLPERQVRVQAGHPRRQHHRVQDRVRVRRDDRGLRGHLRGGPGPDAARPLPADLRQPRAGVRADHRAPTRPVCRCSWAPTRSPRPRTCCTSWPSTNASG